MTATDDRPMAPFEHVVAEHGAVVMRVCRALVGSVDADDAWSETFLSALRAYPDLRPDSDVRAWLVTIAHRKAIDLLRRASRAPTASPLVDERVTHDETVAGSDDLRAALDALAPKQRAAVIYHYLADLPYAQVATIMETTEAAARRSAADGIANLRKLHEKGRL